jgi:hypothetical protein
MYWRSTFYSLCWPLTGPSPAAISFGFFFIYIFFLQASSELAESSPCLAAPILGCGHTQPWDTLWLIPGITLDWYQRDIEKKIGFRFSILEILRSPGFAGEAARRRRFFRPSSPSHPSKLYSSLRENGEKGLGTLELSHPRLIDVDGF